MPVIEIFDLDEEQAAHKAQTAEKASPKKSRGSRKKTAAEAASTSGESAAAEQSAQPAATADKKSSGRSAGSKAATDKKQPAKRAAKPADDESAPKSRGGRKKKLPEDSETPAADTASAAKTSAPQSRAPKTRAQETPAADGDAPQKSRTSRGRRAKKTPDAEAAPQLTGTPDLTVVPTPEMTAAAPETAVTSVQPLPEASSFVLPDASVQPSVFAVSSPAEAAPVESAPFVSLPPLVEFSPTQTALSMSRSILPAVEPPLTLSAAPIEQKDGEPAAESGEDDAQRPSRSRSRSARRRKAAARRRAEAAAADGTVTDGAVTDDDAAFPEMPDDLSSPAEAGTEAGVIAVAPDGEAEYLAEAPASLKADARYSDAAVDTDDDEDGEDDSDSDSSGTADVSDDETPRKKRSRSRGRGRKKKKPLPEDTETAAESEDFDDEDEDFEEDAEPRRHLPRTDRKMLVSVLPGELVEVVMLESGKVQEYYVEMEHHAKIRGNIYKGIVSNIDVNLQAAFVNYGNVKNGFLQIDEVHPEYWLTHHDATKGHKYPPIQKVMKPGQEVLVQVVKEPNGAKGAFLTTWVSLAGRFLVLTPGQEQIGISRKVEDGEERSRLRELIKGLNPGEGLGAIVRTVSAGTSKTTLQKDLSFLKRVWKDIRKRAGTEKAPCLIYKEPSLATRSVRDYLSDDVSEVWVDDADTAEAIRDMTSLLFPRKADLLHLHQEPGKTLWEQFKVRKYLDQIHSREVILPSGGRLVFDQTEALMAIDINSGKTGGKTNFESMALRTNEEAAEMIAHQLRLRDIGGQVVIDFIEMRDQNHVREVEKILRNAMKCDRARYDIGKMSAFGLLQIVRQRIGSSAISISQEPCPHCSGTGLRRNMEWQALQILRDLKVQMRTASNAGQAEFILPLEAELALYILNHKRERLATLEKEYGIRLEVKVSLS